MDLSGAIIMLMKPATQKWNHLVQVDVQYIQPEHNTVLVRLQLGTHSDIAVCGHLALGIWRISGLSYLTEQIASS